MLNIFKQSVLLWLLTVLCGCMQSQPETDYRPLLEQQGFRYALHNQLTPTVSWLRLTDDSAAIHIYIEGDGRAWNGRGRPSTDPTPRNPVALLLAAKDQHPNVMYIARPCQFVPLPDHKCHFSLWTKERYAWPQIESVREVIFQRLESSMPVILIGFSGGAFLAGALASELPQVKGLVTVAGNIKPDIFAHYHRLTTPEQYGFTGHKREVPVLHLTGNKDKTVPPVLTRKMVGQQHCQVVRVLSGADHSGPWIIPWAEFNTEILTCQ